MKKLSITIILIISILVLAACGSSASPDITPFWGQISDDEHAEAGNGLLERSEYAITVKPLIDENENQTNKDEYKLDPDFCEGTYTVEISRIDIKLYEVKTEFEFKGKYNKDGQFLPSTGTFTDDYTSKCTFEIVSPSGIKMISSEKTVENYTYLNTDDSLSPVKYTVKNTYEDNKMVSNLNIISDPDNILEKCEEEFTINSLGDYFFDNEAMFLAIRTLKPAEGFSLNFKVPENISQKAISMSAKYVAQKAEDEFKLNVNGTLLSSHLIQAGISGTNQTGAPINLYYSKDDEVTYQLYTGINIKTEYYKLLKIEHGDMIYELEEYENFALKK
ncbi:MAG: hypothetical protein FWG51_03995 [Firmicutes bacterium]|nr:hypothetical protein [Bacillota bacterium]